jgi:hypothetical protein
LENFHLLSDNFAVLLQPESCPLTRATWFVDCNEKYGLWVDCIIEQHHKMWLTFLLTLTSLHYSNPLVVPNHYSSPLLAPLQSFGSDARSQITNNLGMFIMYSYYYVLWNFLRNMPY